jgi:hypothetical protein
MIKLLKKFGDNLDQASCSPSKENGEGGSHIVVTSANCGVLNAAIIIT